MTFNGGFCTAKTLCKASWASHHSHWQAPQAKGWKQTIETPPHLIDISTDQKIWYFATYCILDMDLHIIYYIYQLVQDLSYLFWTHRRVWRLVWQCQVRFLGWYLYKQKTNKNTCITTTPHWSVTRTACFVSRFFSFPLNPEKKKHISCNLNWTVESSSNNQGFGLTHDMTSWNLLALQESNSTSRAEGPASIHQQWQSTDFWFISWKYLIDCIGFKGRRCNNQCCKQWILKNVK